MSSFSLAHLESRGVGNRSSQALCAGTSYGVSVCRAERGISRPPCQRCSQQEDYKFPEGPATPQCPWRCDLQSEETECSRGAGPRGACSLLAVRPLHLRLSEAGERFIASRDFCGQLIHILTPFTVLIFLSYNLNFPQFLEISIGTTS